MTTQENSRWKIWRTILWREWRVNRHLILNLFGLWLVVTLVLPVYVRTTPVVLTCVMLGQLLAVRLAGGDSGWGSEAFSLSLPPLRDKGPVRAAGRRPVIGIVALIGVVEELDNGCVRIEICNNVPFGLFRISLVGQKYSQPLVFIGGPCRIRICDQPIKNQELNA